MILTSALRAYSGSCSIGDEVHMGGQVGVAQHVTIGSGARVSRPMK